jgi:hypothetical protein
MIFDSLKTLAFRLTHSSFKIKFHLPGWMLFHRPKPHSSYSMSSRRPTYYVVVLNLQDNDLAHKYTAPSIMSKTLHLRILIYPASRRMPAAAISANEAESGTRSLIDKRTIFFPPKYQTPREPRAQLAHLLRQVTHLSPCRPLQLPVPPLAR